MQQLDNGLIRDGFGVYIRPCPKAKKHVSMHYIITDHEATIYCFCSLSSVRANHFKGAVGHKQQDA